jgi:hypothetical protein
MAGEDQAAANRNSAEFRAYLDELWRRLRVFSIALQLGLPVNRLRFLELGLVTRHELSESRLRDCARTVGDPALYDQFRERLEP